MYYGVLKNVRSGTVRASGWTEDFLKKQQNGLTGHYRQSGYPFDTAMWNGGIDSILITSHISHDPPVEAPAQTAWWPYEQSAYLLDGLLKTGILLDDCELLETVQKNLFWLMEHAEPDGRLGTMYHCDMHWPMAVFFRIAMAWAEYKDDDRVRQAFIRHYLAVPTEEIAYGFRHINNVEGLLISYEWSGNSALLSKAEEAYHLHNERGKIHPEDEFELHFERLRHPENYVIHGVSFSESIKLPVLLYLYTGKQEYLKAAEQGLEGVLARHEQLPGLPSSNEDFAGKDPLQGYETCVINDFCWALRYFLMATGKACYADRIEKIILNALPAAVDPDFHSLVYLSCVNQVIAAPESQHSFFHRGSSCNHQFRPGGHCAQCCTGNIHHIMPNFVMNQFFSNASGEPVAVLYAPAEYDGTYQGKKFHISETGDYPDEEEIKFHFQLPDGGSMPFSLRIPAWCQTPELYRNGIRFPFSTGKDGFARIEKVEDQSTLLLRLPMKPVFHQERNWCWFEAGPQLFSFSVPYLKEKEYESEYAPLRLYPNAEWNWSPLKEPQPELIRENGELRMKIKATKISGFDSLENDRYTPEIPLFARRISEPKTITLLPYRKTMLRITAFPDGKNRKMLPVYQTKTSEVYPFNYNLPLSEQQFLPEKIGEKELLDLSQEIVADRDGYYDLQRQFGLGKNRLAYISLRFWSDLETNAIFSVGASTVGEFFVNGVKYMEQPVGFDAEFMSGLWFNAPVHPGFNILLVKVAEGFKYGQYREAWGVRANIFHECC